MQQIKILIKSFGYSFRLIFRSSRYKIIFYLLLSIVGSTLPIFGSFMLKSLIDTLSANDTEIKKLILYVSLYALTFILTYFVDSCTSCLFTDIDSSATHEYRCELLEDLNTLPMSFLDSSEGRDQIDDVSTTDFIVVRYPLDFIRMISSVYSFVVSYVVLVGYSPLFSAIHILLTVPSIVLNAHFNQKIENLRYRMAPDARKFSYYRWMLTDASPAKDVRMYDLTEPLQGRYEDEKSDYIQKNKAIDKKKCKSLLQLELLRRGGEISFIIFVITDVLSGTISVGDVTLYISLVLSTTGAFETVFSMGVEYIMVRVNFLRRMFEFKEVVASENEQSHKGTRKLEEFKTLEFEDVCFKYPHTDKYILSGVSFKLNAGEKLSIVGINGAGKSTIIKLMLGLYEVESGRILINGYPMQDYDIHDVRGMFSALFQNFVQYPLSLRDNIALSDYDRASDDDEIIASLKQSGVYDELQDKLECGLESYMTRQFDDCGTEVSRGQWQKIALSRTYFKNADIIIFDEPSAALDAEAEDRIFRNFEEISDGKTGIMISHRISAARMSDNVIVLDGGKIVESGSHDELVLLGGLYAKLYNLQKEKYTVMEA